MRFDGSEMNMDMHLIRRGRPVPTVEAIRIVPILIRPSVIRHSNNSIVGFGFVFDPIDPTRVSISFQGPHVLLRSKDELIDVYHRSVGHNCVLMLDLTPDRSGLIPPEYAMRYKELGDFIRSCYGTSVAPASQNSSSDGRVYMQVFDSPVTVDRSVIGEDQSNGQVIRSYTIDVQQDDSWKRVASGTSIGNKKIDLWSKGIHLITAVRLNITETVDKPVLKGFSVHLCS